jgi:hypothetical protein
LINDKTVAMLLLNSLFSWNTNIWMLLLLWAL